MKASLFAIAMIAALIFSACDSEPSNPAENQTDMLLKAVEDIDLSNEQLLQIDEMFWLEEDLSSLLTPMQLRSLNTVISRTAPDFATQRDPRRIAFDMAALMHLRLIFKANPDLDENTKRALVEMIQASNQTRRQIIRDNIGNPEQLRALLKAEHERLIAQMNAALTPEQLANVEELKERLKQLREELREKWVQIRIDRHIAMLKNALDLSDEQAAAIRAILLAQHEQIKQLRETYQGNPEGLREALKTLLGETDAAMIAVLTPEQAEKWELIKTLRMKWRNGGPPHTRG
jgi:Spy/CpxP family protein refolding chaperone